VTGLGAHYILSAGHEVLQFPYSPPMLSSKDKQFFLGGGGGGGGAAMKISYISKFPRDSGIWCF
jgi:hypothetical protein